MFYSQMVGRNLWRIMVLKKVVSWFFGMLVIPLSRSRFLIIVDVRMKVLTSQRTTILCLQILPVEVSFTWRMMKVAVKLQNLQLQNCQKASLWRKNWIFRLMKKWKWVIAPVEGAEEHLKVYMHAIYRSCSNKNSYMHIVFIWLIHLFLQLHFFY